MSTSAPENATRGNSQFSCSLLESFLKESQGTMDKVYVINCGINGVFSCVAILTNTLIMATILLRPRLRSPTSFLLFGLAVSDFGVGLLAQPLYVVYKIAGFVENSSLNCAAGIAFVLASNQLSGVSLLTMTLLSVDRYLGLHLHLRYNEIVTVNRVKIAMVSTWILSASATVSWLISLKAYYIISATGIVLFLIATLFAYTNILFTVRRHRRQIQQQAVAVLNLTSASSQNDTPPRQDTKTQDQTPNKEKQSDAMMPGYKKSAKNMFLIYIVFLICVLPFTCVLVVSTFMARSTTVETAFNFTMSLVFINSSMNPFLYCILMRDLRREVRNMLVIVSGYFSQGGRRS